MKLFNQHLATETLINWADGKLSKDDSEFAKIHLKVCSKCQSEASKFVQIVSLLQKDDSKDAPPDLIVWAKNLFRTHIAEPKKSFLQKMVAILEMDLPKNQPAFGERSSISPIRQMLFRADEIGITLRISNDEGKISVMGQVLGEKFGGCKVVLKDNRKSFLADANELSEFKIQDVPDGIYNLTISNDEKEILVENVELN